MHSSPPPPHAVLTYPCAILACTQGDFKDDIPPLIIKNYGTSHKVPKSSIYVVEVDEKKKRKVAFYGGADSEEEEA